MCCWYSIALQCKYTYIHISFISTYIRDVLGVDPNYIYIYIYAEYINSNFRCRCMCASFRNKEAVFVYAVILPSSHIRKCVCTPNVEGLKSYPNCTLLVLRQRLKINKKASKWNKQKRFLVFCVSRQYKNSWQKPSIRLNDTRFLYEMKIWMLYNALIHCNFEYNLRCHLASI